MQISGQSDIGIGDLLGNEVIPDVAEVNGPIRCDLHPTYHVDTIGGDHVDIRSIDSHPDYAKFVADRKGAEEVFKLITCILWPTWHPGPFDRFALQQFFDIPK